MASSSSPDFPESERFIPSPSAIVVGAVIPPNTFINGQTVVLFPLSDTYPDTLRLKFSSKYPSNVSKSDYVAASPTKHVKWKFNISLGPTEEEKTRWTDVKTAMMEEHETLKGVLGLDVKLVADGLVVTKVEGRDVHLEGKGGRMMWTESKGAWTMFQATSQSTAPSWLRSPTLPPSIDLPTIPKSPPHPAGYRPITALLPPRLNLRASNDAYFGSEKRKRSDSPPKRAESSTTAAQAPLPKKTIIGLGSTHRSSTYSGRPAPTFGLQPRPSLSSSSIGHSVQAAESLKEQVAEPTAAPTEEPDLAQAPDPSYELRPLKPESPPSQRQRVPSTEQVEQSLERASPNTDLEPSGSRSSSKDPSSEAGPSMPLRNARAEAEAAARARALRLQAVQNVQEERERARANDLRSDSALHGVRYTVLSNLRDGTTANLMGVVVKIDPPKRFQDFAVSLVITDPSIYTGEVKDEDLVVTLFRRTVQDLPMSALPGTPILFRGLKMRTFKDKVKGNAFSNDVNGWVYLLNGNQPKISDANTMFPPFSGEELNRLQALGRWWDTKEPGRGLGAPGISYVDQGPSTSRRVSSNFGDQGGQKLRCLGELGHWQFSDIIFKIVHVAQGRTVDLELYIADGTLSAHPLRNFHGVEHPRVGRRGIYCVGIQRCAPEERPIYEVGNYVLLRNVRSKMYKDELELTWSELVTQQQDDEGWRPRKPVLISPQDERALEIERRISGTARDSRSASAQRTSPLKREAPEDVPMQVKRSRGPSVPTSTVPARHETPLMTDKHLVSDHSRRLADHELATHVFTVHNDPINHPTQTLSEVLANRTFPNKFRVRAKVQAVHTRRIKGLDSFAQKHCGRCNHAIVKQNYCQSCSDLSMEYASWQYRFVVILEDEEALLPILIQDKEAARFLPPLPPYSTSTNPNDARKTSRQLEFVNKGVLDVLQGAPMDNIRPQPYIDWTIASHRIPVPPGYVGPHGEKQVVVYKAFGMGGR